MKLVLATALLLFVAYQLKKKRKLNFKSFSKDLSQSQKKILQEKILYYQKLSEEDKLRFSKRVAFFLKQIQIKPVDCKITNTDKLYLGASAIIPVFGFDNWQYTNLKTVFIFPDAFNEQLRYKGANRRILGLVGSGFMTDKMVLSLKALRHGFENKTDKNNTAIHEFVHLIDMVDGETDGLPLTIIKQPYTLPWLNLIHAKIEDIEEGDSDINPYGATSKIEFFAVASEYFFERPKLLKRKHPKLYKKLSIFFNQDLA